MIMAFNRSVVMVEFRADLLLGPLSIDGMDGGHNQYIFIASNNKASHL